MNIPLKTKIKYWYFSLRLAHQSDDPAVQENLKKSKSFYKDWGDYLNQPYEKWWKEHSHLFKNDSSFQVIDKNESFTEDALYLKIPYIYPTLTVSKMVKEVYQREYEKRNVQKGKVKKQYSGKFCLTKDDYPVSQFDYFLKFTKEVYLPLKSKNTFGTKPYRELAEKVFSKQKKVSLDSSSTGKRQVPFQNLNLSLDSRDRTTTRYRNIAENLLANVAYGYFPGVYDGAKSRQSKKDPPKYTERTKLRGVSQKRYQTSQRRKNVLDPYKDLIPKKAY